MLKRLLWLLCVTLLSACGSNDNSQRADDQDKETPTLTVDTTKEISHNGRVYRLAFPDSGFDEHKAYKLLLAFHGSGQSAKGMQEMVKLESFSDDYLVVYPKSKEVEWDDGCGCNIAHRLNAQDVGFVVDIIQKMHAEYNLLEGENYAVGFSQGGLFSQNMMCKHSELFKGVASVASPMSVQLAQVCTISSPTHYMMVQGDKDAVLPYSGLEHSNFGLISAPSAIELIARQNQIESPYDIEALADNVLLRTYRNEQSVVNQLVTIKGGYHTWSFNDFNTSEQILAFFDQSSDIKLPTHSALYRLESGDYHVRSMGEANGKSDIILLSGANKFFHSDSAWTTLIHPMLAEHGKVHVIDRLGSAWSSDTQEPSFSLFAADLPKLLEALKVESAIFVAFANGNLATLIYQHAPSEKVKTQGMIWVDPDILLPHSINQYQSGPVASLREYKEQYIEYVSEGPWTESSIARVAQEREEIGLLISQKNMPHMDWDYYDAVTAQRSQINKQVTRIKEMMNYHDDLEAARYLAESINIPITIIDSDFERLDIANAEESEKAGLIQWQNEGTQWSKDIAHRTQGHYFALENASHQVLFEHPETVIEALIKVLEQH
ncbi:alpha/beta hydrolase [Pseudoalteromonas sp. T1lg23B]|uniref:alpha/beta hydrolase n=1 Tax=Pseudoalteromonas sp. T1lg23B TaxID=2077097 RepID=UPI000CF72D7E|nr:alpha/beta hydrolase [Pseudoalteromonas sp. T1lg23B]